MPRPIKWRNVCGLPENERFGPIDQLNGEMFAVFQKMKDLDR